MRKRSKKAAGCKCDFCGRPIQYIRKANGGNIACELKPVFFWPDKDGRDKVVALNGDIITCTIANGISHNTKAALLPHWAVCSRKPPPRKESTQLEQQSFLKG